MNLYFLSGLGADKRMFQKLVLPDSFTLHYIDYVPVLKNESLESYCRRLSEQIDLDHPFSLVGLSFGGVISVEMSKFLSPVQTVLISSFYLRKEVPWFYLFLSQTRLYKLLPEKIMLKRSRFIFRLFGAYNPEAKNLLEHILHDTDPVFFHWALMQLFSWHNEWKPEHLLRIHGTEDRVLPYKPIMNAITVEGGEHLMIYSKWERVSEILTKKLMLA